MEPAFIVCTREGKCLLAVAGVYIVLVDGELPRNNDLFECFLGFELGMGHDFRIFD